MAKYPAVITTMAGTNATAEANASKQALIFTKIVIGAGNPPASIPRATALTDKRLELAITKSVKTGDGQFMVQGLLSNTNLATGFYAREIGLMAKVGENGREILFSYTNGGNYVDYIPDKNTPMDSYTFTITTVIGNAEKVQAIVSDKGLASIHDLNAHNTDEHAHDIRFAKYLPLAGGTVTGNINLNNAAVGFNNGNNPYDAKIRVGANGNFDIGVTEDAGNKNATNQLLLHSQNRPKWYNSADGSKQLAIVDEIEAAKNSLIAAMNNYLPLAGGTVTGAINFINGSFKGQIALKPNGNLDLGSLETKCSVLNSRERPLWYTGDARGGMLALTRDIVPDPTQCVNLYDAKSEGYYDGRPQGTINLKLPYTDYDYLIIVLSADSGQFMGVSQINVSWLEKTRKMSVGTGLEIINIATVGNFYWGINNKSTPTNMITNSGYENSHIWEIWGYKITR